jgi:hypothetical protein
MAEDLRHAAGRPTYEVREILDGDAWVDMAILFRCNDYVTAVEFAFDYLGRRDPRRTGAVGGLQVIKDEGSGRRETVWTYKHTAEESRPDPVRKWGFDITRRWTGPTAPVPRPTPLAPPLTRLPRRI